MRYLPEGVMSIGACDNCDRQNVPVSSGQFCGCDTTQCFVCQGDTDPDPYGELEGSPAWVESNGQFGVGA